MSVTQPVAARPAQAAGAPGFLAASGIALAALVTAAVTIRIRREDLTSPAAAVPAQPAGAEASSTPAPPPAPEGE
jgi:hypothetical protein